MTKIRNNRQDGKVNPIKPNKSLMETKYIKRVTSSNFQEIQSTKELESLWGIRSIESWIDLDLRNDLNYT